MLTVKGIKDILKQERIFISKCRGQNFLIDERIKKMIIEAVDIGVMDEILEIGPGLGALTEELAKQANKVIAVEKDRALARVLQERLSGYKNLQIFCQDILHFDIENKKRLKLKVVGNLPYYITTPIIGYLLEQKRQSLSGIFITVQEEVGRRLVAKAQTKDYSALTIFVKYFTQARILFFIPKRAFYPQPKVDSVFVHLRLLDEPSVKANNPEQFFRIVRTGFNQRRKTILNSLTHKMNRLKREQIQGFLSDSGIDVQARPETLSLEDFARIEDTFYKRNVAI